MQMAEMAIGECFVLLQMIRISEKIRDRVRSTENMIEVPTNRVSKIQRNL